jgi:beta-ureidopropionase / N-carbamoyl-L-amino-acid hydrolase
MRFDVPEHHAGLDTLEEFAFSLFEKLRSSSFDGVGITRESYGIGEGAAHDLIAHTAAQEGLRVDKDVAKNLIISLPGQEADKPFIACGSHLDSVPQGGNFDGAAGVIAALTAIVHLKRAGFVPPRTVKVFVFRAEESAWFGKSWLGSSAMFGLLTDQDLSSCRSTNGQTLREAMIAAGVDLDSIIQKKRLLDPRQIAAFLELHIEQGPVMVARNVPVAVVTAIYGNIRHMRMICHGHSEHAGAVPRSMRRDAAFAVAHLIVRLDFAWEEFGRRGENLVVTCGMLGTNPSDHAISRIPGEVSFSLEIRAERNDTLERFYDRFEAECRAVANERNVRFEIDRRITNLPAPMDARWVKHLSGICKRLDLPHELLPSGAGHDAAVFVHAGIPTAMVFIRNEHGSHNPREAMQMADFMAATRVLTEALCRPLFGGVRQ